MLNQIQKVASEICAADPFRVTQWKHGSFGYFPVPKLTDLPNIEQEFYGLAVVALSIDIAVLLVALYYWYRKSPWYGFEFTAMVLIVTTMMGAPLGYSLEWLMQQPGCDWIYAWMMRVFQGTLLLTLIVGVWFTIVTLNEATTENKSKNQSSSSLSEFESESKSS